MSRKGQRPFCLTAKEAHTLARAADKFSMPEVLTGEVALVDPDSLAELAQHSRHCDDCRRLVQDNSRFGGQYVWMTTHEARVAEAREAAQMLQPRLF